MEKLGIPLRIYYRPKGDRLGLSDVVCRVFRPDLSIFSDIQMMECRPDAGMAALYTCVVETAPSDQEGTWLVRVISATVPEMVEKTYTFERSTDSAVVVEFNELQAKIEELSKIIRGLSAGVELQGSVQRNP